MSFPTFPSKRKTCAPAPTAHPHKECEAETAQSAPSGPLGHGFRPGVLPLPPHPPYPGSKYGSWTCSVRLQASPSAEPEERLAASDYIPTRGRRGRGSSPARPAEEQKGSPHRLDCPGPRSRGGAARPGSPRTVRPGSLRAGYLFSLSSSRGGASGLRVRVQKARPPLRGAQAFALRELKLGLQGFGEEHPRVRVVFLQG